MSVDNILTKLNEAKKQLCYPTRIQSLRSNGRDTSQLEEAVKETSRVLSEGGKSFVIYGEPQSGKTELMIALTCKFIDLGYQTIFVVMNDNTELETQNFDRFHIAKELNPTPVRDWQVIDHDVDQLRAGKQRIIFCRKNAKNLDKLINSCRFMEKRVLIDDEADYATPDTNINKKKEATSINQRVGILSNVAGDGVYIGVTATPGRLDLNNTYLNKSSDWVYMRPYDEYKGRSFFFPLTKEDKIRSNYILTKLPDEGDDSKLLKRAIYRFMLRTCLLNSPSTRQELTPYSMLIHTAGKVEDHITDKKIVDSTLNDLSDPTSAKGKKAIAGLFEEAQKLNLKENDPSPEELIVHLLQNVGKHEVLIINHQQDKSNVLRSSQPKALFTFAIGGNIVSRGLTFERLLTFFFSRNVKGNMQHNTYIQRARMFGNRPYSEFFELCVPESLFKNWAETFQNHELSLRLAKSGNYQHIQTKGNRAVDKGAIDENHVDTVTKGERPVGSIIDLTDELESALCQPINDPVNFIRHLKSRGLIASESFAEDVLTYIEETTEKDPSKVAFVRRMPKEGVLEIQDISQYSDGDNDSITRTRGGIVDALINKRAVYHGKQHYILPIKNSNNQLRFLYRNKLGHTILNNSLNKKV